MESNFAHISDSHAVLLLAFIGGLYDTSGYLLLHGIFTSSITGNLVVACASVASSYGTLCRSLLVVSFVAAGFVNSTIALRLKIVYDLKPRWIMSILFLMELLFVIIVFILGIIFKDNIQHSSGLDDPYVILIGCLMAAAMGFHNEAAKESIPSCPPTTVMTSTLINASIFASSVSNYFLARYTIISLRNNDSRSSLIQTISLSSNSSHVRDCEENNKLEEELVKYNTMVNENLYDSINNLWITIKPLLSFSFGGIAGAYLATYGYFYFSIIPIVFVIFLIIEIIWKEVYINHINVNDNNNNIENEKFDKMELNEIEIRVTPTSSPNSKGKVR